MENWELQLLNAAIAKNDISAILSAQGLFVAYDREAQFILDEYDKSGKIPSIDAVDSVFNGFSNCTVTEPPAFYAARLHDRKSRVALQKFLGEANALLKNSPSASEIDRLLAQAPVSDSQRSAMVRWDADSRLGVYLANRNKANVVTDFPWPSVTMMCGELRRGHYMSLCGRPKMGKTFVAQVLVHHAWKRGVEPLVLSGEMPIKEMQGRFDCIDAKVDAGKYYRGTLSPQDTMRLIRAIRRSKKAPNAILFQDRDLYSLADVQSAVAASNTPLVFLDGAYLFEAGAQGRSITEKMVHISRTIKRMANRFDVAMIATFQQNRLAEGKAEGGGASSISWGDTVLMDSDIIFEVCAENRFSPYRRLQSLGARNSRGGACMIRYKPSPSCDFSEIFDPFVQPTQRAGDE